MWTTIWMVKTPEISVYVCELQLFEVRVKVRLPYQVVHFPKLFAESPLFPWRQLSPASETIEKHMELPRERKVVE